MHLHTNTESGSPCAVAQHYAGSDNTTIGLCLKVCLVSLSLYPWLLLYVSPSGSDSIPVAHCSKRTILGLWRDKHNKKSCQEWDRRSWPAIKHLPHPGVNVQLKCKSVQKKQDDFLGKSTEATASIWWKKKRYTAYLLLCSVGAKEENGMSAWMDEDKA